MRLQEDALAVGETADLAGLTGVRRNQALKRILHNRSAADRGRHFILWNGSDEDTVGQLTCRDCDMQGRWSCFKFFSKVAQCKRGHAGESMVRIKMMEKAEKHNLGAADSGLHVVELVTGADRFVCKRCGKVQPKTAKHCVFLAARCEPQG